MSFATRITGGALWVGWVDAGGTIVISGDQKSFDPDFDQDTAEMSAGSDTMRVYKATLKNAKMKLETFVPGGTVNIGTATAAYRMREGALGTLLWAPQGTATGFAKWGLQAISTGNSYKWPYDDGATLVVDFKPQSDLLFDGRKDAW